MDEQISGGRREPDGCARQIETSGDAGAAQDLKEL